MAQNVANDINYYLHIDVSKKDTLANIRTWTNLKIGIVEESIWVKGFDFAQINSVEVKSIADKTIYYEKNNKLHLYKSLLPDRNIPNSLWTSIDRVLSVKLRSFNHNYFGIQESINIKLIVSNSERNSNVIITSAYELNQYIQSASSIRLEKLKWTILNNDKVLIIGSPLLPIKGDSYYQLNNHIIPSGYEFEFEFLASNYNTLLNINNDNFIIWNSDCTYALIDCFDFETLTISSFRQSLLKQPIHI